MTDRLLARYLDIKAQEDGQTMVEYALVLLFVIAIAALALTATGTLGAALDSAFEEVSGAL